MSVAAKTEPELEKKLNSAAGFRMVPKRWREIEFLERHGVSDCDGKSARRRAAIPVTEFCGKKWKRSADLSTLSEKGYWSKGMSRIAMGITVLMEKIVVKEIPV